MGHIVNPRSFRLGVGVASLSWSSKWFINISKYSVILDFIFNDYYIISYIYYFFKNLKKHPRQVLLTTFSKKIQKKLGTNKFKKRVRFFHYIVLQQSLVISHIKILRISVFNLMKIGIFFLDSSFVVKLNHYFKNYVKYSVFDFKEYKKEKRFKNSLLSSDEKRLALKRRRYSRKKVRDLLAGGEGYKIKKLFPVNHYEYKLKKKKFVNYLGGLNKLFNSLFYKRIFKNFKQTH